MIVDVVNKRMEGYTRREFLVAKEARRAIGLMVYPPESYMEATVSENMILKNPITRGAIKSPCHIFGPDVSSLKRETVSQKPSHSRMQYVTIPRQIYGHKHMIRFVDDLIF